MNYFQSKNKIVDLRKTILLLLALAHWIYCMIAHITLSDFVTSYLKTPWGLIVPRDYSIQFGMGILSLMTIYFIIRLLWGERKIDTMVCFTLVIAVMFLSFRVLIFEPVEIIHFPQYAIVAFLLAAALEKK